MHLEEVFDRVSYFRVVLERAEQQRQGGVVDREGYVPGVVERGEQERQGGVVRAGLGDDRGRQSESVQKN